MQNLSSPSRNSRNLSDLIKFKCFRVDRFVQLHQGGNKWNIDVHGVPDLLRAVRDSCVGHGAGGWRLRQRSSRFRRDVHGQEENLRLSQTGAPLHVPLGQDGGRHHPTPNTSPAPSHRHTRPDSDNPKLKAFQAKIKSKFVIHWKLNIEIETIQLNYFSCGANSNAPFTGLVSVN